MRIQIKIYDYGDHWEILSPGTKFVYLNNYTNSNVSWDIIEKTNKTNFWKRYKKRFG